ncbi:bleomycin resistance protein [Sphingobacterium paludis]|nr:VOC family protein [Sphingobacterium paludis]
MLTAIIPKLPMRDKTATKAFYLQQLGFSEIADYGDYLLIKKDHIEIHFFAFAELDPTQNYGQIYLRTQHIDDFYQWLLEHNIPIHPNGHLETKPWGQQEFSLLDPDNNLLTFGQDASS